MTANSCVVVDLGVRAFMIVDHNISTRILYPCLFVSGIKNDCILLSKCSAYRPPLAIAKPVSACVRVFVGKQDPCARHLHAKAQTDNFVPSFCTAQSLRSPACLQAVLRSLYQCPIASCTTWLPKTSVMWFAARR